MTEGDHLIWSNYDLDYEDWRDSLEEEYPDLSEDERIALMYELNSEYLGTSAPIWTSNCPSLSL